MQLEPVLFASANAGKQQEASALCAAIKFPLITLPELKLGEPPQVEENAGSYEGNARLKAEAFSRWSNMAALGDDTGLEVDALNGEPGIISARYAGLPPNARANMEKLLSNLRSSESRRAIFRCCLYLYFPDGRRLAVHAELPGAIAREPKGSGGFGYDCIFIVAGTGKTLAELKAADAPVLTHRGLAFEKLSAALAGAGWS